MNDFNDSQYLRFPPIELRHDKENTLYTSAVASLRAKLAINVDVSNIPAEALLFSVLMSDRDNGDNIDD